jgi:hypothetical protein
MTKEQLVGLFEMVLEHHTNEYVLTVDQTPWKEALEMADQGMQSIRPPSLFHLPAPS